MTGSPDELSFDEELAERLADDVIEDSTVEEARAELDTVANSLKRPAPEDPFAGEPACDEAVEALVAMGREPSFDTRERLAGRTPDETPIRELGQYRLVEKLGEGGMGAVYKAVHGRLEKVVALKVLPAEKLDDEAALQRFDREMRAVGKLQHPNIVAAFDAGEVDDVHYLVMELVEGEDLSAIVRRRGPLPVAEACELVRQAALGLQHAHEHGMVHRDVKPSNLMLTTDGTVKVLDLGLALLADHHETTTGRELTTTGQLMGTLDYMAPEQGVDTHAVDVRADVYSLGATLYKLLCGDAPFAGGKYDSPIKKLRALAVEDVPPLAERRENLPPGLADVVHRMLAREPEDRYATPADVAVALESFTANADAATLLATTDDATAIEVPAPEGTATKLQSHSTADFDPHEETITNASQSASSRPVAQAAPSSGRRRAWPLVAAVALLAGVGLWAAVFFLQTEHGVIRVEITGANADEVEVTVKGTGTVLTGPDEKPVHLKPGEKTLTVTRGDFSFDTDKLVLKPGEDVTVKVDFLPGEVKVSQVGGGELGGEAIDNLPPTAPRERFALRFDGAGSVRIGELPLERDTPVTIEAWVRSDSDRSGQCVMCVSPLFLSIHNRGEEFSSEGVVPIMVDEKARSIGADKDSGSWNHMAVTLDPRGVARTFVNGFPIMDRMGKLDWDNAPSGYRRRTAQLGASFGEAPAGHLFGDLREARVSTTIRYTNDFTPATRFESDEHTLALYHFDEGSGDVLKDSSGNGHHGKIVGAKWVEVDARSTPKPTPRVALRFDGDGDRVELPRIDLDWNLTPVTFEAWVTPSSAREPRLPNVMRIGPFKLRLHREGPQWMLIAYGEGDRTVLIGDRVPARLGERTHLAGVFDGNGVKLFVDGQIRDEAKLPRGFELVDNDDQNFLGAWDAVDENVLQGTLHAARLTKGVRYTENFTPEPRFQPDADTLALYHVDEGEGDVLTDSSGNGHHGKIVGAEWVELDAPSSPPDRALAFDGDDHVTTPVRLPVEGPFTIEARLRVPAKAAENQLAVSDAHLGGFGLGPRTNGKWRFDLASADSKARNGAGYVELESDEGIRFGEWTHLAAVHDGRILRFYVDGRTQVDRNAIGTIVPSPFPILLGANPQKDGETIEHYVGALDELRISKIARYAADFEPPLRHAPDEHTVALYHFDEGEGDVLVDASGNGHHGKIVGAKWVEVGEGQPAEEGE